MEVVFDRNKGAFYTLNSRALRGNPQLLGKLVLELTIAPSGEVAMCPGVSSELNEQDVEGAQESRDLAAKCQRLAMCGRKGRGTRLESRPAPDTEGSSTNGAPFT
jgi:hypothetical protein